MAGNIAEVRLNMIEKFKKIIRVTNKNGLDKTSLFLSLRLVALSKSQNEGIAKDEDIYNLAEACYKNGDYKRAAHYIISNGLHEQNFIYKNLALTCLKNARDLKNLELIMNIEPVINTYDINDEDFSSDPFFRKKCCKFAIGEFYDAKEKLMEKKVEEAIRMYQDIIRRNIYFYEVYEALIENKLIGTIQGKLYLEQFSKRFEDGDEWIRLYYLCKLDHFDPKNKGYIQKLESLFSINTDKTQVPSITQDSCFEFERLIEFSKPVPNEAIERLEPQFFDNEIEILKSNYLYAREKYNEAYYTAKRILQKDKYCYEAITIYALSAGKINEIEEIDFMAISLEERDQKCLSYYLHGIYHMHSENYIDARKYFEKATIENEMFPDAELALGIANSFYDHCEEALKIYRNLMVKYPGWYYPLMYSGMEKAKAKRYNESILFFQLALDLCDTDPLLFNEYGVSLMLNKNYEDSYKQFKKAIDLIPEGDEYSKNWIPLYMNIATLFRLYDTFANHLDKAEEWIDKVLKCDSSNAIALTTMAFIYTLKQEFSKAREYLHQALLIDPDDETAKYMLNDAFMGYL